MRVDRSTYAVSNVLEWLLAHGFNFGSKDKKRGETPCQKAMRTRSEEAMLWFIEHGDRTPVDFIAQSLGDENSDSDDDEDEDADSDELIKKKPLIKAIFNRDSPCVQRLLEGGTLDSWDFRHSFLLMIALGDDWLGHEPIDYVVKNMKDEITLSTLVFALETAIVNNNERMFMVLLNWLKERVKAEAERKRSAAADTSKFSTVIERILFWAAIFGRERMAREITSYALLRNISLERARWRIEQYLTRTNFRQEEHAKKEMISSILESLRQALKLNEELAAVYKRELNKKLHPFGTSSFYVDIVRNFPIEVIQMIVAMFYMQNRN